MKLKFLLGALLCQLPLLLSAQNALTYITNNGAIIITGFVGPPVGVMNVVIPATINGYPVTRIGNSVFSHCYSLMSVTIPNSVTSIGERAFDSCASLRSIIFLGNAPTLGGYPVFYNVPSTVYYYHGTSGWGATYGGLPTVMLSVPQISAPTVDLQAGHFGFTVTGSVNHFFVVEASADLVNWQPIATNILSGPATSFAFTDSDGTNYPRRFYRVGAQVNPPHSPPFLLVTHLSGASGSQTNFMVTVLAGTPSLVIKIFGGSGDCDLYVKYGTPPTTSSWHYRPYKSDNNETVTVANPAAGNWYIMLHAYQAYFGVTLQVGEPLPLQYRF